MWWDNTKKCLLLILIYIVILEEYGYTIHVCKRGEDYNNGNKKKEEKKKDTKI